MRLLAKLKYYFDLGNSFISILNMMMLSFLIVDKLKEKTGISFGLWMPLAIVPIVLGLVILNGYVLDRFNYQHHYQDVINERNNMLKGIAEHKKHEPD